MKITEQEVQSTFLERVQAIVEYSDVGGIQKLEERAGLPSGTVAGWAHTPATLGDLVKVAVSMGVTTDYLLACNQPLQVTQDLKKEMYLAKVKYEFFKKLCDCNSNDCVEEVKPELEYLANASATFSELVIANLAAEFFGVSVDYLLGKTDDRTRHE